MKVSDYLAAAVRDLGVRFVFGFQGSNVAHLIDSITRLSGISYIQNHHEQASAFAANAYAEITGGFGAAVASSGPGAINLLGGVANAWFDSIPCLFLTGQLNTRSLRRDTRHRQNGFQEFDVVSAAAGFTKYAVTVLRPEEIRYHFEKAVFLAGSGRKGPVLLDLPHNLQTAEIDPSAGGFFDGAEYRALAAKKSDPPPFHEIASLLKEAKRPLMLLGGGACPMKGSGLLEALSERLGLPVAASLNGLDAFGHDHPNYIGFIGSFGSRAANTAVRDCDVLLVLGSRLDPRQTGDDPGDFAKNARVIHVDIDEAELHHYLRPAIAACSDCGAFTARLLEYAGEPASGHGEWIAALRQRKARYQAFDDADPKTLPNAVIRAASRLFGGGILTADVGQHQMWTAQSAFLGRDMRLLNSGGLGSMGYALPAAIGAAFARRETRVLCVAGDGGLQMNLQELNTVAREKLPVKILLMNNQSLGLIRSYQAIVFDNLAGSVEGFSSPDYALLAKAFGFDYLFATSAEDIEKGAPLFLNDRPLLCEARFSPDTEIHPEPAYRQPVYVQSPIPDPERCE